MPIDKGLAAMPGLKSLLRGRNPVDGETETGVREMARRAVRHALPGLLGLGVLVLATALWVLWGTAEMFYEGWWGPWSVRLPYLVPGMVCLALSLVAAASPLVGGWLLVVIGGSFTVWWWQRSIRVGAGPVALLTTLPVSGFIALAGILLLAGARRAKTTAPSAGTATRHWYQRNLKYLVVLGVPLAVAALTTAYWLPLVNGRLDDGCRDAVLIEGNGIRLVWAPAGPGWSEGWVPDADGGKGRLDNPSWDQIALYGLSPVGLGAKPGWEGMHATAEDMRQYGMFRFLSPDGLTLLEEPQDVWRMPTVDELVRSLVRGGKCAGCIWDGQSAQAVRTQRPDKETPLWAPDRSPIYYWAADEYQHAEAYYVGYQGTVGHQSKSWGNPRHGYRFVRQP